jgi:hypothetical protein
MLQTVFFFSWNFLPLNRPNLKGKRSRYSDSLRAGRSGDRFWGEGGGDFPLLSRPALRPTQPPVCTKGTGSFPGVKAWC